MSSPGESLLLRAGLVRDDQLDEARRFGLLHGATVSEALVAIGALDEEQLVEFFHRRLLVPRIDPRRLAGVPEAVLALVPADMAVEFRVLSVALDRAQDELVLAMADPADTHIAEEVGFFAGRTCLRAVATPSALRVAIERHYRRPLPPLPSAVSSAGAADGPPQHNPWKIPHKTPLQSMPIVASPVGRDLSPPPAPEPAVSRAAALDVEPVTLLTQVKPGAALSIPSASPSLLRAAEPLPLPTAPAEPPIPLVQAGSPSKRAHVPTDIGNTPVPLLPLAELRIANGRDTIDSLLLDYLGEVARAAGLLVVRRGLLAGFEAHGEGIDDEAWRWISIPLEASSIFRDVVESRLPYRGPLPRTPPCLAVEAALGRYPDAELLLPVCVGQRAIAVLVAAGLKAPVPDEVFQELGREAGLAYERLIRSRKS